SGTHGQGSGKHGRTANDLVVKVPEGTVVRDHTTGEVLAELDHAGDKWLAAAGGEGGKGNARFLSNKRRAPAFAEQGEKGTEQWFRLELRLFADVALVGFPNAGKSTLISRVSAAKPKIADYPFTTLVPNLGVVRLDDVNEFVMADIPGLIEGASEGAGLGLRFLRHVERARVLLYLLDLTAVDETSPADQLRILRHELGQYKPDLLDRPSVVVGSKADVLRPEDWGDLDVDFAISAVTGENLQPMLWRLMELVNKTTEETDDYHEFIIHRPMSDSVTVVREDDGAYRVLGREAERSVALSDLTNWDALNYARARLEKLGVNRALRRAGIREGDEVRIGDFAFDYQEDR
ncbi:MAG: Obg family GTPase CgtA, partial [Acidimicrobiales bacterium]